MSLIANGKQLNNGADMLVNWGKIAPLVNPATQPEVKVTQTKQGSYSTKPGAENWEPRKGSIYGHLRNQANILAKIAALGVLGTAFNASTPATIQLAGRQLRNVNFQGFKELEDKFTNNPGGANYAVSFIAKDPFWWDLAPWACYGYAGTTTIAPVGAPYGLNVGSSSVDPTIVSYIASSSAGLITMYVPGSACAYGVGSVTVGGNYTGTLYLKSDRGARYTAVQVTNGLGILSLSDRLYLAPGKNVITAYTQSGGVYSVYAAQTVTLNLGQTYARWSGFEIIPTASSSGGYSPPLVFARTGTGTYQGVAGFSTAGDGVARFGLPNPVRRNGLASSENLLAASWGAVGVSIANAGYAYKGSNVFTITQTSNLNYNYYRQLLSNMAVTVTSGSTWVITFYATQGTGSTVRFVHDNSGIGLFIDVRFGLSSGTTSVPGTSGATCTPSMVPQGDGWWKCTLVITYNVTPQTSSGPGFSATNSGTSNSVNICQPQFEPGSTATPYQPTNASGMDLTHPINGAGLVLEGSSTNLLTQSSGFETGSWTKSACTVPITNATAPDGTSTARKLVEDTTASAIHRLTRSATVTSGQVYTESVIAKAAERSWIRLVIVDTITNSAYFNLANGTVGGVLGGATASIANLGNGWYLCSITRTASQASLGVVGIGLATGDGADSYTGDGASGVYLWESQLEPMPFPTTRISTTTATATRQPDLCGIVYPHNGLKQSEGFGAADWNPGTGVTANATAGPNGNATAASLNLATISSVPLFQRSSLPWDGNPRTFAIRAKGDGTAGQKIIVYFRRSDTLATVASTTIDLTTSWQTFVITRNDTIAGAYVDCVIGRSTTSGTAYVAMAQLNEASMAGIYVRTTDTTIARPADSILDPSLQQNMVIKFRAVLPPISQGKAYAAFGCRQTDSGNYDASQLGITRLSYQTTGDYQIFVSTRHNGNTGSNGVAGSIYGGPLIGGSAWDGMPHDYEIHRVNYLEQQSNGSYVRRMYFRLYFDANDGQGLKLKMEVDAAALHGASSWGPIDLSKLVSDGTVNATISGPSDGGQIIRFPTLPSNAIAAVA